MKQKKLLLFTAILIISVSAAIFYTSCQKDACSGVNCLNGGACNSGTCTCPSGYTGTYCETVITTTLVYQNNTFTPVNITINGSSATIQPGSTVSFDGTAGAAATGTASTHGFTTSGSQVGLNLEWNINDNFPSSGTQTQNINVSSTYFYLKITNNSAYNITQVYVNYGLTSQTLDNVTVPNNGVTYNIGYYDAWTNSNLYLTSGSTYWSYNIGLSFIENQSYIFTAY